MQPHEQLRKAVKGFYAYVGATLLAGFSPVFAAKLVESHSTAARIAGVTLGVGAWIPIMFVVASIIKNGDEFVRRMHLVALSIAFAGALILISLFDWLARAGFLTPPPLMVLWVAVALLWVFALLGAKRYYERPR